MANRRVTKKEVEDFKLNYRITVIEKMAVKALLLIGALPPRSLSESHDDLKDWLDLCSTSADQVYGRVFRDPAQVALYGDEVRAIVEEIKKDLDSLVREIRENLRKT